MHPLPTSVTKISSSQQKRLRNKAVRKKKWTWVTETKNPRVVRGVFRESQLLQTGFQSKTPIRMAESVAMVL